MFKNVGRADRIVRYVLAAVLVVWGLLNLSTGWWWIGLLAVIPLATGLAGYCPIWHMTGIRTNRAGKPRKSAR